MRNLAKKLHLRLLNHARKLASDGLSVIPIQGDRSAAEPKRATIKWRPYQKRIAGPRELEAMFDDRAGALGIVCGQVSQLVVIDFDDHLRYQRFCRQLPQFAETYTVKTKRGYHVYFRTGVKVPTHQFDGGDIKGERSYVVAAPSMIAGFEYRPVKQVEARCLDGIEVDALLNHFHSQSSRLAGSSTSLRVAVDVDIAALYERLRSKIGRNNALYRCVSLGKQQGMRRDEIEKALLRRYVWSPSRAGHKYESVGDRLTEGMRTIASALGRDVEYGNAAAGIPNSVRERLLQAQGSAVTARLLDILYMAGWQADKIFSLGEAIDLCAKYGLNRKSVMAGLAGELSSYNGRHIIARRYVEYLDIGGLNSRKRGRPVQLLFQAPSVSRLLKVLGVRWSPADSLVESDLRSSHAYRRALHREYVRRVSPGVSMSVLADRLGLNARSLRRYNAQLGVHVCQRIGRFRLSWDLLKCLPRRERNQRKNHTPGYWLGIEGGARLPAWRHIGAALLRRAGGPIELCVRRTSVLTLGARSTRSVIYESLSVEEFLRIRMSRDESVGRASLLQRLGNLAEKVRARAAGLRYERLQLQYDTVSVHIAEDKVAETIVGYLVAKNELGDEVRRPARRGIAYRMLKEFGEGNVYLALRESYGELLVNMARHAFRMGAVDAGAGLFAKSMA